MPCYFKATTPSKYLKIYTLEIISFNANFYLKPRQPLQLQQQLPQLQRRQQQHQVR